MNNIITLTRKTTVFLDMDGVLCDFVASAARAYGIGPTAYSEILESWPRGDYGVARQLDISEEELWRCIDAVGTAFWENLAPYPQTLNFITACESAGIELYLLSSPSLSHHSAAGKVKWMQRHLGPNFRNYILTSHKHFCAGPDRVLIDDLEKTCTQWESLGGRAYCPPRLWNNQQTHAVQLNVGGDLWQL